MKLGKYYKRKLKKSSKFNEYIFKLFLVGVFIIVGYLVVLGTQQV